MATTTCAATFGSEEEEEDTQIITYLTCFVYRYLLTYVYRYLRTYVYRRGGQRFRWGGMATTTCAATFGSEEEEVDELTREKGVR